MVPRQDTDADDPHGGSRLGPSGEPVRRARSAGRSDTSPLPDRRRRFRVLRRSAPSVRRADAAGDCGSQFLSPRPTESELPPFYPGDYHAYNENHGRCRPAAGRGPGPGPGPGLRRPDPGGHGRIFDVGYRRLPPLRRTPEVHRPRVRRGRDPAGDRRQGPGPGLRRDRGDPRGGRPDRPSRALRRGVDEPRPRTRRLPRTMLERARTSSAPVATSSASSPRSRRGSAGCSAGPGAATTTPATSRSRHGRGWPTCSRTSASRQVTIRSAPHIQTTISLQNTLVSRGWRPRMQYGKTPAYSALLVASLPFETVAWAVRPRWDHRLPGPARRVLSPTRCPARRGSAGKAQAERRCAGTRPSRSTHRERRRGSGRLRAAPVHDGLDRRPARWTSGLPVDGSGDQVLGRIGHHHHLVGRARPDHGRIAVDGASGTGTGRRTPGTGSGLGVGVKDHRNRA